MEVSELNSNRGKIALELFEENKELITYKNVSFRVYENILHIMTSSDYLLENTTKLMAVEHIEYSKKILNEISVYSKVIQKCIETGKYAYYFLLDYGNGSIEVASEINGNFKYSGK